MERQIKFRGLRTDGKGWVYGDLLQEYPHHNTGATIQQHGCLVYEVHSDTVGQFTGLHDKNGKEIYEGDFLSNGSDDNVLVIWRQDLASFALTKEGWMYDHYFGEAVDPGYCKVVGTIHDRKEVEAITCGYCDCEFEKGTGGNYGEYGEVCINCYEGLS